MERTIVIQGHFGAGNVGDEAILASMLESLRKEAKKRSIKLSFVVLSRHPEETTQLHGVPSVDQGGLVKGFIKHLALLKSADLFISGGGVLKDTPYNMPPYWISRIGMAKLVGTPVMIYSWGVGPFNKPVSKAFVKWGVKRATQVTVRNMESKKILIDLGLDGRDIQVTTDPSLTLRHAAREKVLDIMAEYDIPSQHDTECKGWIGVNLLPHKNRKLVKEVAAYLDFMSKNGYRVLFIPLKGDVDLKMARLIRDHMGCKEKAFILDYQGSPSELIGVFAEMSLNITMRYHGAIFSFNNLKPTIGLANEPKVGNLFKQLGQEEYLMPIDSVTKEQLAILSEACLVKHDKKWKKIKEELEKLEGLAESTAVLALDCLG